MLRCCCESKSTCPGGNRVRNKSFWTHRRVYIHLVLLELLHQNLGTHTDVRRYPHRPNTALVLHTTDGTLGFNSLAVLPALLSDKVQTAEIWR